MYMGVCLACLHLGGILGHAPSTPKILIFEPSERPSGGILILITLIRLCGGGGGGGGF